MQEFEASPLMAAYSSWADYMRRIVELNHAVRHGLHVLTPVARANERAMRKNPPESARDILDALNGAADNADKEIQSDFEFVHALILMGSFGAFEAYVKDVCIAALTMNPALLRRDEFSKVKLKPPVSAEPQVMKDAFEQAQNALRGLRPGTGKFEPYLKIVGLNGVSDLTPELRDTIEYASRVRHAWAHRAGKADARFIENCGPRSSLREGDTISISTSDSDDFIAAITTYGWLIVNRFLLRNGLGPFVPPVDGAPGHYYPPYLARWREVFDANGRLTDTTL